MEGARKAMSLGEMHERVVTLLDRLTMYDGRPAGRAILVLDRADITGLEAIERMLMRLIPVQRELQRLLKG